MKRIFFIAIIVACITAVIAFGTSFMKQELLPSRNASHSGNEEAVASVQAKHPDIPVTLTIPKLAIEADVESVGLDSNGDMDVPQDADNVAWYNLGYKPGEKGSAVIAGHFDKVSGAPAVFYDLEKLSIGDRVITKDKTGETTTFTVVRLATYPDDMFPLQEVFGQSQKSMLNLITCDGKWNKDTNSYSHRTVVYTEMSE